MRTVDTAKLLLKLGKRRIREEGKNKSINNLSSPKGSKKIKFKNKFRPRTDHEGPEGEMYSCTLSLTSALEGVGGQRHAQAALPPGKKPDIQWQIRGLVNDISA